MSLDLETDRDLRAEIRRSWERSAMCGLDRGGELELPYLPDLQAEERFLRAAAPVLDQVASFLEGSRTTAVLTDARGRVLVSKCDDGRLARVLDSTHSVPGFEWSEEYAGTTAVSLAIEERMPAWVGSGEHYLQALGHLVCAAVPLIHPIGRRLLGVVDVTSEVGDASRHMMPVALQAAKAIEERLYEDASDTERVLLSHFMSAANRSSRPIVVLGERVELSTPPAARLLDVADRTLLWQRASELVRDRPSARGSFTLTDGREIEARFVRVDTGGRPAGVAIELEVQDQADPAAMASTPHALGQPARRREHLPTATSTFVGRSCISQCLRDQAQELRGDAIPLLIVGEPGVGKLTLAKAIAGEGTDRVLVDAARTTAGGEDELLSQVATVADSPGKTVIVRRVGCLSPRALHRLAAIAAAADANSSRVIATATISAGADGLGDDTLAEAFGLKVVIPPLRERTEDLLDLIPYLIARRGATARMAPSAIQALMRCEWGGNVRELDVLVRAILTRKRTADIVVSDLPADYQRGSRRLRRIEHVERAAIVQALREVNGNKTRAADLLEIGRATLYRKIRAYGLDLELTTS